MSMCELLGTVPGLAQNTFSMNVSLGVGFGGGGYEYYSRIHSSIESSSYSVNVE